MHPAEPLGQVPLVILGHFSHAIPQTPTFILMLTSLFGEAFLLKKCCMVFCLFCWLFFSIKKKAAVPVFIIFQRTWLQSRFLGQPLVWLAGWLRRILQAGRAGIMAKKDAQVR